MKKPVIGVTPDFTAGDRRELGSTEPTLFVRARYSQAIEDLGGVPVILPLCEDSASRGQLLHSLDGLLLTGSGPDLPPQLYGERQRYRFRIMNRRRYEFELAMVRLAVRERVPVFGICGGMQAINVACGGSLIQDIASDLERPLRHQAGGRASPPSHWVEVQPKSLLHRIARQARIKVNSSHHQSIKEVAPSLVVTAVASDGVVEAVEAPAHPFLLGVQWHPEFLYASDAVQKRLFKAFLLAAQRGRG
jgi:putative glutamine amidotransferase